MAMHLHLPFLCIINRRNTKLFNGLISICRRKCNILDVKDYIEKFLMSFYLSIVRLHIVVDLKDRHERTDHMMYKMNLTSGNYSKKCYRNAKHD